MQKFEKIFGANKARVIGMIHANALPGTLKIHYTFDSRTTFKFTHLKGTPNYKNDFNGTIEKVRHEAHIYKKQNVVSVDTSISSIQNYRTITQTP